MAPGDQPAKPRALIFSRRSRALTALFRLAVTGLSISALIENKSEDEKYLKTIRKAEDHLLENLPNLRRATPMALYNAWAHSYGLQALARMHKRTKESDRRQKIKGVMVQQVQMLQKYESVDGGWGYYDFNLQTKQPSGSSISFVNATGLVALKDAQDQGVEIPKRLTDRAIAAIHRQRLPDHSYLYGEYLKYKPRAPGSTDRPAASGDPMPATSRFSFGETKPLRTKCTRYALID